MNSNLCIPEQSYQEVVEIWSAFYPSVEILNTVPLSENVESLLNYIGFEEPYTEKVNGTYPGHFYAKFREQERDFKAIAHLIPEGTWIEWKDDEDGFFKWEFDGKNMKELSGEIVWR